MIIHLLWECAITSKVYKEFQTWIERELNIKFTPALFGTHFNAYDGFKAQLTTMLILIAKHNYLSELCFKE